MNLVDRFLHYVSFDTQSDELTHMTPSTPGQMIFAQELEKELRKIGMTEVSLDENGYLMATLPPNTSRKYSCHRIYRPSRYKSRPFRAACYPSYHKKL